MEFIFMFWVFLIGILIATVQDLKRREVDNWLNFLLLCFGFVNIIYLAFFNFGFSFFVQGVFVIFLGFVFANVFYYGHVFAGGDAKLLLALSSFFVGVSFFSSFIQFLTFVFLLLICGGIYGLLYSLVLYFMSFKRSSEVIWSQLLKIRFLFFVIVGVILMLFYFVNYLFFIFGCFVILFPLLYSFAKGLEEVVMKREIPGSSLREGDWLVNDIRVGKKVIRANFDGVSLEDIALLENRKKVLIREGIPFVPSFLFAFVVYWIFSDMILLFVESIFSLFR